MASIEELLVCEETLTSTGFSFASFSSSCSDVIEASFSARLTGNKTKAKTVVMRDRTNVSILGGLVYLFCSCLSSEAPPVCKQWPGE